MSGAAVETLLYLMDEAFEGRGQEHGLLGNLASVKDDDWQWVAPGGSRPIRQVTAHVAACKWMYNDHAFGAARLRWTDAAAGLSVSMEELQSGPPLPDEPPMSAIIGWLTEGHRRLREHVAALDDSDLLRERGVPWGELKETRWIIAVMIEHDLYHAGEINHIRSLHRRADRWAFLDEEGE